MLGSWAQENKIDDDIEIISMTNSFPWDNIYCSSDQNVLHY